MWPKGIWAHETCNAPHFLSFPFHNPCLLPPRCPDGYFGPRCLQTEPLRSYMPKPDKRMLMFYEQLRTEARFSLDLLSGFLLALPRSPPVLFFFLLLSPSQVNTQWAVYLTMHTWWCHPWERSASAACGWAVVLTLCLSPPLSPSLPSVLPLFSFCAYSSSSLHSYIFCLSLVHHPPPIPSPLPSISVALFLSIRCPNDFTGDRCQTYVMASFYRMSTSSSVIVSECVRACWV